VEPVDWERTEKSRSVDIIGRKGFLGGDERIEAFSTDGEFFDVSLDIVPGKSKGDQFAEPVYSAAGSGVKVGLLKCIPHALRILWKRTDET
jgi:hypothetical protein